MEWGEQVKAAFDLYRLPLLQKLGYELKFADTSEEKRVWEVVSYRFSFPDRSTSVPDVPYKMPSTYVAVVPPTVKLNVTRTATQDEDGSNQIRIVITNVDPLAYPAEGVLLREEIPVGSVVVRDSATIDGAQATLKALDPILLDLGPLPYYETRTVVFKLKVRATG